MDPIPEHLALLRALTLELRRELEGSRDANGRRLPGDLDRRLAALGVGAEQDPAPPAASASPELTGDDRAARAVVDALLARRAEAGLVQAAAIAELVQDAAFSWANRLLALRCMESRGLIGEVILQRDDHGGRSRRHHRLAQEAPARCAGDDGGLFAVLFDEFAERAAELPRLFDPSAPEVALRPSVAALKRCLALLSGAEAVKGHGRATSEVFTAPETLGWAYQHWNAEEKARLFASIRTRQGAKIGGADVVPATCIYTPRYLVAFLVQNSLGALWLGMRPESPLRARWDYLVRGADPMPRRSKPVREISFFDPACGSGHFLLEAFDLFYAMYVEEGEITEPRAICGAILAHNLFGVDIDERAVQIAALALVMKAKERAPDFAPRSIHLVATNIPLPAGRAHVDALLRKHPEDAPLEAALLTIFGSLAHAAELGSLVQIEEPVDRALRALRAQQGEGGARRGAGAASGGDGDGDGGDVDWSAWKRGALSRLCRHFAEDVGAPDLGTAFFGEAASRGLSLVDLLTRRYDVVAMNPPYIGFRKLAPHLKDLVAVDGLAKLDIYVAFLSRFFSLLDEGGSLAAVSPSSWTTSSSTGRLRRKMLDEGGPRIVAALGQYVFSAAPLLFVSLQVISRGRADGGASLVTLRPTQPGAEGLLRAAQHGARRWPHAVIAGLETTPFLPVAPLELLQKAHVQPTVGDFFSFVDGVWTGSNERDIREGWEVPPGSDAWVPVSGGQGYARWYAPLFRRIRAPAVDAWPARGARSCALEYARVAGGKLAARVVRAPSAAMAGIVSVLPKRGVDPRRLFEVAAVFNSRLGTVWLRTLTSGLNFNPGYAARIPLASQPPPDALGRAVERVVSWKRALAERDIACDDCSPALFERSAPGSDRPPPEAEPQDGIGAWARRFTERALEDTVKVLELEDEIEQLLKEHLAISEEAWREIDLELGTPVAAAERAEGGAERDDTGEDGKDDDEDDGRPALPVESDLEALARTYGVHPRALLAASDLPPPVTAAIDALRAARTVGFVHDYLVLLVLRLFGHRFPREVGGPSTRVAGRDGANPDGIIPLTDGAGERSLFDRLRERLAAEFAGAGADAVARELAVVLGKPLERWIEADLARVHAVRFGRRPVLWQLQSGRCSGSKKPAFAAIVYYHRLDGDTLPRIRRHYLGPQRARLDAELRGIEASGPAARSRTGAARRVEIESALEELRAFDARLAAVIDEGFAPASPDPAGGAGGYDPDLDDGVRVNLAPLQRAGVLAAEVLAPRDVDRAIADRAAWRAVDHAARRPDPRSRHRLAPGGLPRRLRLPDDAPGQVGHHRDELDRLHRLG